MKRTIALGALLVCLAGAAHALDRDAQIRRLTLLQPEAVRLALDDMAARWPQRCGATDRSWCGTLGARRDALLQRLKAGDAAAGAEADALLGQVRTALLANPLLDADRLLVVRRGANNLALPQNWQQQRDVNRKGLTNEIAVLTGLRGTPAFQTVFQAEPGTFVGDLQLHWDARRLMFTGENAKRLHRVYELDVTAPERGAKELPLIPDDDVTTTRAAGSRTTRCSFSPTPPLSACPAWSAPPTSPASTAGIRPTAASAA